MPKLFKIPIENIDTSDLRVKIQVSQDGNISSKSFPIEFKNDYLMLSSKSYIAKPPDVPMYKLLFMSKISLTLLLKYELEGINLLSSMLKIPFSEEKNKKFSFP